MRWQTMEPFWMLMRFQPIIDLSHSKINYTFTLPINYAEITKELNKRNRDHGLPIFITGSKHLIKGYKYFF